MRRQGPYGVEFDVETINEYQDREAHEARQEATAEHLERFGERMPTERKTGMTDQQEDQIIAAVDRDDYTGICKECWAEIGECEPDTRDRMCEACGKRAVFGAEQLLSMLYGY